MVPGDVIHPSEAAAERVDDRGVDVPAAVGAGVASEE
jgi:hypothetical protein